MVIINYLNRVFKNLNQKIHKTNTKINKNIMSQNDYINFVYGEDQIPEENLGQYLVDGGIIGRIENQTSDDNSNINNNDMAKNKDKEQGKEQDKSLKTEKEIEETNSISNKGKMGSVSIGPTIRGIPLAKSKILKSHPQYHQYSTSPYPYPRPQPGSPHLDPDSDQQKAQSIIDTINDTINEGVSVPDNLDSGIFEYVYDLDSLPSPEISKTEYVSISESYKLRGLSPGTIQDEGGSLHPEIPLSQNKIASNKTRKTCTLENIIGMGQEKYVCQSCNKEIDSVLNPQNNPQNQNKNGPKIIRTKKQMIVVCDDCIDKNTIKCEFCQEFHFKSESEEGFCPNCVANATRNIHHYSTKAESQHKHIIKRDVSKFQFSGKFSHESSKEKKGLLSGDILFGVEIEYQAVPIDKLNISVLKARKACDKFAVLKYDRTLDIDDGAGGTKRAGFEITSAPADKEAHYTIWDELLENGALDRAMQATDKCGVHVHRSKDDLNYLTLGKILKFIHSKNNRYFITLIAGREPNMYCDFNYEKKITDSKKNFSGKDHHDPMNNHRTAINFHTSNRRTIEFRIFRGTRDKCELLKNVDFVDALCNFCKICSLSDYVKGEYCINYVSFIKYVVINRSQYKFLYRFFQSDEFNRFANKYNPQLFALVQKKSLRPEPVPENNNDKTKEEKKLVIDPSKKFGGAHLFPKTTTTIS